MSRYGAERKAETRERILTTASRQFRQGGIADVGIAGIMTESGLTNGAFYAHFASKNELVRETIARAMERQRQEMEEQSRGEGLEGVIRSYLSVRHRDHADDGCPSAAMLAEIGRAPSDLKASYQAALDPILDVIEERLGGDRSTRRARATSIFALLVGTIQLARATTDSAMSQAVLDAGISAALTFTN